MKIFSNVKIWIIIALVLAVAGAAILAFFGFNQTPDYKPSYEVTVSADQNVKGADVKLKTAAKNYFSQKGYGYSSYATQTLGNGAEYIFKFNNELKDFDIDDCTEVLNEAVNDEYILVTVSYEQTFARAELNFGKYVLAAAVGLVAVFVILYFVYKLAAAVTVAACSVVSAAAFILLVGLTRIPAAPYFSAVFLGTAILSVVMTVTVIDRFAEGSVSTDKKLPAGIAAAGIVAGYFRLRFVLIGSAVIAAAFALTFNAYMLFTGLQIAVSAIVCYCVTILLAPTLWVALKSLGKK